MKWFEVKCTPDALDRFRSWWWALVAFPLVKQVQRLEKELKDFDDFYEERVQYFREIMVEMEAHIEQKEKLYSQLIRCGEEGNLPRHEGYFKVVQDGDHMNWHQLDSELIKFYENHHRPEQGDLAFDHERPMNPLEVEAWEIKCEREEWDSETDRYHWR